MEPHAATSPRAHGGHIGSTAGHGQRPLMMVLLLTGAYTAVQVVGGLLFQSLALLADAGHMLADTAGLAMALFAIRFAHRPATPTNTYGFYRAEILAALLNSLLLLSVAGAILHEAWQRLHAPSEVAGLPTLLVAIGGFAVNLVGVKLLHAGSGESLNLRGAYLEVLADLLGSLGVIASAAIVLTTGWQLADPLIAIGIGLLILPRTWHLLKSTLDVLLEASPSHLDPVEIEATMLGVPDVVAVHELHVWTITSGFVALSAHVRAKDRRSSDVLHDLLLTLRRRYGIEHATIQVERVDHADDEGACCVMDPRCLVVGERPPVGAAAVSER